MRRIAYHVESPLVSTESGVHDQEEPEVPDGAAVFPDIPADLNISPMLLAMLHAIVFVAGSDNNIVNSIAGDEALATMAEYLGRLDAADRGRISDDLQALLKYAKEKGWPKQYTTFLKDFPKDFDLID